MSRVLENLYLGGLQDASNSKRLKELGIRTILIAAKELPAFHARGFVYLKINADPKPDADLGKHFVKVAKFIDLSRPKGGVLVHCVDGASRSAAFVAAYLMKSRRMGFAKVLSWLESIRKIRFSDSLQRQLRDFERDEAGSQNPMHIRSEAVRRYQKPNVETRPRAGEQLLEYMTRKDHATTASRQYQEMFKVYRKCLDPQAKATGSQILYGKGKENPIREKRCKKKSLSVQKSTRKGDLPSGIFQQSKLFLKTSERVKKSEGNKAARDHSAKIERGRLRSPIGKFDRKQSFSLRKSGLFQTDRFLSCEKKMGLGRKGKRAETERSLFNGLGKRQKREANHLETGRFSLAPEFSSKRPVSKPKVSKSKISKQKRNFYTERDVERTPNKLKRGLNELLKGLPEGGRKKGQNSKKRRSLKKKEKNSASWKRKTAKSILLQTNSSKKGNNKLSQHPFEELPSKKAAGCSKFNPIFRRLQKTPERQIAHKSNEKQARSGSKRKKFSGTKVSKSGLLVHRTKPTFKSPEQNKNKIKMNKDVAFEFGSADIETRDALKASLNHEIDTSQRVLAMRHVQKLNSKRHRNRPNLTGLKTRKQKISKFEKEKRKYSEPVDQHEEDHESQEAAFGIRTLGIGRVREIKAISNTRNHGSNPNRSLAVKLENQRSSRPKQGGKTQNAQTKSGLDQPTRLSCRGSEPLFDLKRQKSAHSSKFQPHKSKSKKGLLKRKLQKQNQRGSNTRHLKSLHPFPDGSRPKTQPSQLNKKMPLRNPKTDPESMPNNFNPDAGSKLNHENLLKEERSPETGKLFRGRQLTMEKSPGFKTQPKAKLRNAFTFEVNKSMNFVTSFPKPRKKAKLRPRNLYQQGAKFDANKNLNAFNSRQLRLMPEDALDPKRLMNRLQIKVQTRLKQFREVAGSQVKRQNHKQFLARAIKVQNLVSKNGSDSKSKLRRGLYFGREKKLKKREIKCQSIDLDNTESIQFERKSVALSIDELSASDTAISICNFGESEQAPQNRKSHFHEEKTEAVSNFRFSQKQSGSKSNSRFTPKAGGGKQVPRLRLHPGSRVKLYSQKMNFRPGTSSDLRNQKPRLRKIYFGSKSPENKANFNANSLNPSQKSVRLLRPAPRSPFSDVNNPLPLDNPKKSLRLKLKKNYTPGQGRVGGFGSKFRTSESNHKLLKNPPSLLSAKSSNKLQGKSPSITSAAPVENLVSVLSTEQEAGLAKPDTASKESSRSGTSNMFSSQGSFNLYSKNKTNNYLVKRQKEMRSPQGDDSRGKMPSFSVESSENEPTVSNLYMQVAHRSRKNLRLVCRNCKALLERFQNLTDHSKRFRQYGCQFLFVKDSETLADLVEREGAKVKCGQCRTVVGEALLNGAKCSCFSRQKGKFKLLRSRIKLRE